MEPSSRKFIRLNRPMVLKLSRWIESNWDLLGSKEGQISIKRAVALASVEIGEPMLNEDHLRGLIQDMELQFPWKRTKKTQAKRFGSTRPLARQVILLAEAIRSIQTHLGMPSPDNQFDIEMMQAILDGQIEELRLKRYASQPVPSAPKERLY